MNINLFMGLNIKKSSALPVSDLQISKFAKAGEPAYDKFKEIMSDIKKHELSENNSSIKATSSEPKVKDSRNSAYIDKIADKNEVNEKVKLKNTESKSLSAKQLKKMDEKLFEFASFLMMVNSSGEQKPDNLTIGIKDGQVIASLGDEEIVINSAFFDSLAANLTANLEQLMKGMSAYFESGSPAEQGSWKGSMTLKDALSEAIFDALNKTSGSQEIPGGSTTGETGESLQQVASGEELLVLQPEIITLAEEQGLGNSLQEIQPEVIELVGEASESLVNASNSIVDNSLTDASKSSNVKKDGRVVALEQALGRLLKQLDIPGDMIDSKIESIIGSLEQDSEELELGKKNFLNLAKKITVELSQLSKKFTVNLEELIAKLETGQTQGKFGLNGHLAKSLRNSEVFDIYADKVLKPFVFQPTVDPAISSSGAVSTNPVTGNTAVNLADVIMQISSRIISKDSPVIRQLEIMLKPESLGTIRIKVEAAGDGVNIKIQTQYSHTEEIISSNLDMLKNNLSEKGVLLKDLSVFMDLNTGASGKSFEGFSGFGDALNQSNSPKQHPEEGQFAKNRAFEDSNKAGEAENTDNDALSNEDNNTYGVDIVA
jgi:flagellar hook-length control protein FliK